MAHISIGTPFDLDFYQEPQPFSAQTDRGLNEIQGIDFLSSIWSPLEEVITWYKPTGKYYYSEDAPGFYVLDNNFYGTNGTPSKLNEHTTHSQRYEDKTFEIHKPFKYLPVNRTSGSI